MLDVPSTLKSERMRMAQLNDDLVGPILREVEANQRPNDLTLS